MTPRHAHPPESVATPITVWRLDVRDAKTSPNDNPDGAQLPRATTADARFLARLSQRLVLTYTSAGDVVVDMSGDEHLHNATKHTGRIYQELADQAAIADLDRRTAPTSLIVVNHNAVDPATKPLSSICDLMVACRLMMTSPIATLAITTDLRRNQPRLDHHEGVRRAAALAALHPTGRIVVLEHPGDGDRFQFHSNDKPVQVELATDVHRRAVGIYLFAATDRDGDHA
jgi:hypothetical protein